MKLLPDERHRILVMSVNIASSNVLVQLGKNHYLSQYWPSSTSTYGVTMPQQVDDGIFLAHWIF